jgi:hypothetical protein
MLRHYANNRDNKIYRLQFSLGNTVLYISDLSNYRVYPTPFCGFIAIACPEPEFLNC